MPLRLNNNLKELIRPYYLRYVYFPLRPERRPDYFRACWDYPYRRLDEHLSIGAPESGRADLLFYPMVDWHTRMQRTQHLARALAHLGHRCIYVNPHLGRQFEKVRIADPAHRLAQLDENIWELHVRLPREPVLYHRPLRGSEEHIIRSAIEQTLDAMQSRAAVQVVSYPGWGNVALELRAARGAPLVYDCHDWLAGFDAISRDVVSAEAGLLRAADMVLFSSDVLRSRHGFEGRSAVIRNAVDAKHFRAARAHREAAVAGYIGSLDSWLDTAAVAAAARANPECRFVLVGRIEHQRINELTAIPNIEFTGEVPYDRLPEVLATFRVGLIPFLINDLTRAVDPIKLYEYFSIGIPVVSTPLPEVLRAGDLAYFASNADSFAEQVRSALGEADPQRAERRMESAERESWDARACELSDAIGRLRRRTARRTV